MNLLTPEELNVFINDILLDYENFRKSIINKDKFKASVTYQISKLKKYEIKNCNYSSRSVCIAPDTTQILDLCLIYNMVDGKAKYILNIKPTDTTDYMIYKNKLYYLDEDVEKYNDSALFSKKVIKSSRKYITSQNSTIKIEESKDVISSIILKDENKKQSTNSSSYFYCMSKNNRCCYLSKNHKDECKECCINLQHYI